MLNASLLHALAEMGPVACMTMTLSLTPSVLSRSATGTLKNPILPRTTVSVTWNSVNNLV
jgi:hypothetical protein